MLEFLNNGAQKKFIVIKIEDLIKYVNSVFKLAMLENDLNDIQAGRKADGKDPCPEYLVINTDEPYANEIIEIMKRNGHWGESTPSNRTEECQACGSEFKPDTNGGFVNAHPFCLKCLIGMADESAKLQEQCDVLSDTSNMLSPYTIGRPESDVVAEMKQHYKTVELLKEFAFYCVDLSVKEHCEQAMKVQKLLRELGHGKWVDAQIAENKADVE